MKLHETVSPEASLRLVVILVYLAIYIRNHDPVIKTLLFLIIIPFTHETFFNFLYSPFGVQCTFTHRE